MDSDVSEKNENFGKNDMPEQLQMDLLPAGIRDLQLFRTSTQTTVFCRGFCFFTFESGDLFSRNVCLVQLHLSVGILLKEISKFFGLGYQQCSNLISRYKKLGMEGLLERKENSIGNRKKIDDKIGNLILKLRAQGKSYKEIQTIIRFRYKKTIANQSIRAWVYRLNKVDQQQEINEQFVFEQINPGPVLEDGSEWKWNGYAGSMILHSMIERSGFLKPFEEYIEETVEKRKSSRGVRRVILSLFFLHALRCKSIEQSKHLVGEDFEVIVGGEFLRLQDLRYAVDEIVEDSGFEKAMDVFFKDILKQTDLGDTVYFTDGHFSTYYGKRRVPKGWDPRRQIGHRGRNTVFLHNSLGENVYFFESPGNTSLSNDIVKLMEDVEALGLGLKRKTLIFDRGGYSKDCFNFLSKEKKMYYVTYLKNKKKEKRVDESLFEEFKFKTEDGEVEEYRIYEKERRWARYGRVRIIILLSENGKQIPIVTNNPFFSAVRIAYLLKRRWREENAFKYMTDHFGIDLLTTYKIDEAPDHEVTRVNPERQSINNEIGIKKRDLEKLQSELGRKLESKEKNSKETISEFFQAEKELRLEIKNTQVDIDVLELKKQKLATKIVANLRDDHVIIAQKRRLLINAIKALMSNPT
jgi:transposase